MQPPPSTPSRGIGMGDGTVQGATILGGGTGQGATISTPSGFQGATILGGGTGQGIISGGTGQGATPSGTPSTPSFRTMGTGGTTTTAPPPPPPRFRSQPRTQVEIEFSRPKFRQDSRPTDMAALEKLRAKATVGIDPQFALTPLEDSDEQLQNTYNVTMRKEHLREVLVQFDMIDVFKIYIMDPNEADNLMKYPNSTVPMTYDLLQMHSSLSISTIREYMQFVRLYGQSYDLQNLEWTEELFKNSCEPSLRDKVVEQSLNIPENERGGPLLFFIAMQIITTASYDTTVTMVARITNMQLTDFQGENVHQACSQLRSAYLRLSNLNALPPDIGTKLLKVMQTSSVEQFNGLFRQWENDVRLKTKPPADYETLLLTAETTYMELNEADEWTGSNAPGRGSAFKTDGGGNCWKCHKPRSDCTCQKTTNWRRIAPKAGAAETLDRDGQKFLWCGTCRLWNKTHSTSQHVVGFKHNAAPSANLATGRNNDETSSSSSSDDESSTSSEGDDANPQQYFSPFQLSEGERPGAFSSAICRGAQAFIANKESTKPTSRNRNKKVKKDQSKSKKKKKSSSSPKKSKKSNSDSKPASKSHHKSSKKHNKSSKKKSSQK